MNKKSVKIVIGSWGSYNECNERALGSCWIELSDYNDWDEIVAELEGQGFELNGIDEELFIQDVDDFPADAANWDYVHPETFFELLKESGVLFDGSKYNTMLAFLCVRSLSEFRNLVDKNGESWDEDIVLYEGYDWEQYGRELFENSGNKIDDSLADYFDFEAYGRSFRNDCAEIYDEGIIEIRNN